MLIVAVLLHEFAHGLGFQSFVARSTAPGFPPIGSFLAGFSDVFTHFIFDNQANKYWEQLATDAEREASMKNVGRLTFDGPRVKAAVPETLAPTPRLRINSPASIAGLKAFGTASFGLPLRSLPAAGIHGAVVAALDDANATGPTVNDACTAITNPSEVAGRIAIVDRGACAFTIKVNNAQNAGAIAVIVSDNVAGPVAGMSGSDPTITIPAVRITLADGTAIRNNLPGVDASLFPDFSLRAGADAQNRALLYASDPIAPGSTVSHFDITALPNQLMEPNINSDLTHNLNPPHDMTRPQMRDIGWYPDADLDFVPDDDGDACRGSDLNLTVAIDGCDSGVTNWFYTNGPNEGCTVSDLIARCEEGAGNHGGYVSCVSHTTNALKKAGIISGAEKGAIQSCAAAADIP